MRRVIAVVLTLAIGLSCLTSCKDKEEDRAPADFGSYGADFARNLASRCPFRKAYSQQENLAGNIIKSEFETLGFEVQTQSFTGSDGKTSNNIVAISKGAGFYSKSSDAGDYIHTERYIVVGAHYDSKFTAEELEAYNAELTKSDKSAQPLKYDGINDNASGVGALMTCAKELKGYTSMAYNIIFVAFGASSDDFAGARAFFNALTPDVKSKIEAMFCIDSIYAGDKIYANSGYNSLVAGNKYAMRRKLYQAYDVAYENSLYTNNNFNLLYNESRIRVDLDGDEKEDIYSEVSANKSDYIPFDEAKIPIVFFDSYDYNFDSIDDMHDTKNLDLQLFDGMIRGTFLDGTQSLDPILVIDEVDQLELRINNVAFVILGTAMKGSDTALTYTQYVNALESEKNSSATEPSASGN